MRLRPRHYLLIVLILGLGVFNFIRSRHRAAGLETPAQRTITLGPSTPTDPAAWAAFDHAAGLRDAPDADFQPALQALNQQPPSSDLTGCKTWLQFYRQGRLHPSKDPAWQDRSTTHLDNCVRLHRDASQ